MEISIIYTEEPILFDLLKLIDEMVNIISDDKNSLKINEIKTEILSKRNQGEILFEIKQLIYDDNIKSYGNLTPIIDLFVTQLGYSPLGSGWKEVNQVEAKKILSLIMTKNLAYFVEIMTLHEAEQILVKLFNFFPDNSQFFTNASFANNYTGISQWNSITKATFDTGVVIISPRHIGILWVEDED